MDTLLQDVRYGLRTFIKKPGLTAIILLALALGIGANTAIFSVVNAVLLRPLPFQDPAQLVMVWSYNQQLMREGMPVSAADFIDWQARSESFSEMAAFHSQAFNLTDGVEPERAGGVRVSANIFSLLGVGAARGRVFTPDEDRPGNNRVVVISDGLWKRRYASDPNVLGSTIALNGEGYTVVGVMPEGFEFPRRTDLPAGFQFPEHPDLWTPLALTPEQAQNRGRHYMAVVARLKPGVSAGQAGAEMVSITGQLEQQYPNSNTNMGAELVPLHNQIVGKVRKALLLLLAAVGLVLLIACANVANLLLARAASRRKEVSIRMALGASRWRLVRQFMTESLLLSIAGGALGLLVAVWGIDSLIAVAPADLPRLDEVSLDGRVVAFTLGLSVLTGILFGLAPALQSSKSDLNETLKEGGRSQAAGAVQNHLRRLLVVAEVALALVLLVSSGLMIKSFVQLLWVDPGFDPKNVVTVNVGLSPARYTEPHKRAAFFEQLLGRVESLPGVESAGAVYPLPMSGAEEGMGFSIEGQPPPQPGERRSCNPRWVTSGYFKAMGIALASGRYFTEQDAAESPRVAIINEAAAERYFPGEDPLGKRVRIGFRGETPREIVGVVKDVKHAALDEAAMMELYVPHAQWPSSFLTLVVRSSSDAASLPAAIRGEVLAIDSQQPVHDVKTMEQLLSGTMAQRRFNMLLLGIFAAVALVLAALGIYGVISYSVTERTHEIGVRMALGAQRKDILSMVVTQGMVPALAGVAIGLGAAFALTRFISSLLYGVSASDFTTFASIPLLLAFVALVACYIPARRATKVDPMVALRYE
jgi:putative ABC transport system permease protein